MLMISSRQEFWDSTRLSDQDEIREVVLSDDSLGTKLEKNELFSRISDKKILLLIHGYNNEEDDVCRAYDILDNRIAANVPGEYDHIVGYSWPGGDDALDYFAAKRRASSVARRVSFWLSDMRQHCQNLDVMTHSMGGRVALLALQGKEAGTVRNLYTTAAAVDNESIQRGEDFYSSTAACERTYVFHSKHDPVLSRAYRIAEFDRALGLSGPEDTAEIMNHGKNVKIVNSKRYIKKHGAYKTCNAMYSYINSELKGTLAPQFYTLE